MGKPYNPRQRGSLDEGSLDSPSRDRVAADVTAGAPPGYGAWRRRRPAGDGRPAGGHLRPRDLPGPPETVAPIAGMAVPTTAPLAGLSARWMNDPTGRHKYRYWDGDNWTENVYDAGVESRDPASI